MAAPTPSRPPRTTRNALIAESLRRTPMFADASPKAIQSLAEGCRLRKVAKNDYLFHEGETAEGFFVIHAGAISVHRTTEDGREQVIRVFYPGEALGEVVIAGDRSYPAAAKAVEESQVILVPTRFFRSQIQRDPEMALRILASISVHLRFLVETVESLKLEHAETRVAHWILLQVEDQGGTQARPSFTLPMAKHLLASQLGITSETLSRVFARLRKLELAEIEGPDARNINVAGLKKFLTLAEPSG